MLYHEVPFSINTDAGGVMDTDLHEEYDTARKFIEEYRTGKYALMIDGKEVRFSELSPQQQARSSVEYLEREAPLHQRIARRVIP